jgi:hypothetical protein
VPEVLGDKPARKIIDAALSGRTDERGAAIDSPKLHHGFVASAMAPPASRAQTVEQLDARKEAPQTAAWEAPTSRIIDSQAHAWVKIANTWRHHAPDEPRAPLSPQSAGSYQPSRPAPDGAPS